MCGFIPAFGRLAKDICVSVRRCEHRFAVDAPRSRRCGLAGWLSSSSLARNKSLIICQNGDAAARSSKMLFSLKNAEIFPALITRAHFSLSVISWIPNRVYFSILKGQILDFQKTHLRVYKMCDLVYE